MLSELERAAHQRTGRVREFDFASDPLEIVLAVMTGEFRFRIQQIHLAGSTIHKEVNNRTGFWLMMRCRVQCFTRREDVLVKETGQRRRSNSSGQLLKQSAACQRV